MIAGGVYQHVEISHRTYLVCISSNPSAEYYRYLDSPYFSSDTIFTLTKTNTWIVHPPKFIRMMYTIEKVIWDVDDAIS